MRDPLNTACETVYQTIVPMPPTTISDDEESVQEILSSPESPTASISDNDSEASFVMLSDEYDPSETSRKD
jgi:hypothetical protein